MGGASSRRKGHDWEREVARQLSDTLGIDFFRNLNETREGNDGDVVNGDGFPIAVQAKCRKRINVVKAVDEASEAANDGDLRVALIKRTNGRGRRADLIAAMPKEDFLALLKMADERTLGRSNEDWLRDLIQEYGGGA